MSVRGLGDVQRDVLDRNDISPGLTAKLNTGWALRTNFAFSASPYVIATLECTISSGVTSASDPKITLRTLDFGPSLPIMILPATSSPFVKLAVTPASSYRMLARS